MSKMKLLYVFITLFLVACSSSPLPRGNFQADGKWYALAELSQAWQTSPDRVLSGSRTTIRSSERALNIIAAYEVGSTPACRSLELLKVVALSTAPFKLQRPVKDVGLVLESHFPDQYHESWHVRSCGTVKDWHVYDDKTLPSRPITVLLLGAA